MGGRLDLYTDASVEGGYNRIYTAAGLELAKRRTGPAMAAWIGWHDMDPQNRPTLAGQAFVGQRGTQSAEYQAALHGLHAALAYVACRPNPPDVIRLHTDNKTVALQLNGQWAVGEMKPHFDAVQRVIAALRERRVVVEVLKVSEKDKHHREAHKMSRQAWNQVFGRPAWRPPGKPTV